VKETEDVTFEKSTVMTRIRAHMIVSDEDGKAPIVCR